MSNQPEPGLVLVATVKRVIDGDTVEVEISRRFNVRIRDLLVAEKNTAKGKAAKDFLAKEIAGEEVVVFIPSHDPHKLMDINSFNRLVGDVWHNGVDVVNVIEENKMGRRIKKGEKPHEGE